MKNKLTKAQLLEVVNSLPGPTVSDRVKKSVIEEIIKERSIKVTQTAQNKKVESSEGLGIVFHAFGAAMATIILIGLGIGYNIWG